MFFLMLLTLGVGSIVAMLSCVVTAVRDNFTRIKQWQAALVGAIIACCIGIVYVTPVSFFFKLNFGHCLIFFSKNSRAASTWSRW